MDRYMATKKQLSVSHLWINWENIFNSMKEPIMILDLENRIINCNQAMAALAGVPADQLLGRKCCAIAHGTTRPPFDCPLRGTCQTKTREEAKQRVHGNWYNVVVDPVFNASGDLVGAIHIMYDVTAHEILRTEDALTGLYNRKFFETKLEEIMPGQSCGIVLCDIDGLKMVNESLGFEAGDGLLVEVAGILRETVKQKAVIGRIGEDTFGVLLPDSSGDEITQVCKDINKAIDDFNTIKGRHFLSLSAGSAFTDSLEDTPHNLLLQAYDSIRRKKLLSNRSVCSATANTVERLLEARDLSTEQHSDRTQELAAQLAVNIKLSENSVDSLRLLGRFHDIGKIGVSDSILLKNGSLTAEEYQLMSKHSEIGYYIALSLPDIAHIADWILKHHERWDGKGYPLKLEMEQIPIECRIMAIVDSYDAMTNDRPYRKALCESDALMEIKRCSGTQFDPILVEKFIEMVTEN